MIQLIATDTLKVNNTIYFKNNNFFKNNNDNIHKSKALKRQDRRTIIQNYTYICFKTS